MPMNKPKIILGIESSCDETSAAIIQRDGNRVQILSNVIASSADLQAKYGGVVPEQAAREQLKSIIPVIQEALIQSNLYHPSSKNHLPSSTIYRPAIDAIAVTEGPGLIGSLLVGVETAKILALLWNKPLVPVNHLIGHFYANWIENQPTANSLPTTAKKAVSNKQLAISHPIFPLIGLLVSGGHTDLVLMTGHGKYKYLGGTRDDASGEAFDKTARLLDLPYPGGPVIAKLAESGNPKKFPLPRPMIHTADLDFSFSGLKTAVYNLIEQLKKDGGLSGQERADIAASIQEAVVDVLVAKTVKAAQIHQVDQIIVAGGVAANRKLAEKLVATAQTKIPRADVLIPPPKLCTDNAAYIATAAFFNYHPTDLLKLQANPNLSLS